LLIPCALRPGVQIPLPARLWAMQVRSYDEIDPLDAFRLSLVAFGDAWDEATVRRVRASDRRYLEEFALYSVDHGRVLAQVCPMRFRVRLTTGLEDVGGVAGVCSHPSVWGRGYARQLMEAAHNRFRELGLPISTLTTSRNIRGYGVYAKMGYVDIAPFRRGFRRIIRRSPPTGYRLRPVKKDDTPTIHALYRTHTRKMLGWTERPPEFLGWALRRNPDYLAKFRVILHDDDAVGYVRTRPQDGVTMEEVVAPAWRDFRAAVTLMESRHRRKLATVNWITAEEDARRFRRLGYSVDGPIPDATMALSLTRDARTDALPRLFGGSSGRFVQYPTEDF
jgi:GNAT superfamily N-acetyltransferase